MKFVSATQKAPYTHHVICSQDVIILVQRGFIQDDDGIYYKGDTSSERISYIQEWMYQPPQQEE